MEPRPKRFLRKAEVQRRIPVGKTKFQQDIVPRLEAHGGKVHLGPRCVAFTEESVDRVVDELIVESANIPDFVPTPNKKRAKAEPTAKKRHAVGRKIITSESAVT